MLTSMFSCVTVREFPYCYYEEISAEGPFISGTEQSRSVHSLEVLVKRHSVWYENFTWNLILWFYS